ncbi:MAG: glycoside hydrolase family 3 C-terminal domain-containing protein [Lachnospiraceae bacterium]|nr:glycoside hydrolase family 3 C-terminal domain-containing protein [Lachnospiraceae bacterium]
MDLKKKAKELVAQMTLEEKAKLTSGASFWSAEGVERLGLKRQTMTDGPHGLRKQTATADNLGLNDSIPSTCFPTASATACSFDRKLMFKMGESLGEKCLREEVAVILGPGVNMKRSPLCGRNFEYFSEDPYVAGEMAAALINGIQSKGVGTSLKHFAVNSQESRRMTMNEVVDERALREIYLAAFETAVKKAQPWTVMCSYNRINGEYADVSRKLLTDILRNEWGYDGIVVSDWGAVSNKLMDIKSGMNLEMPGVQDGADKRIIEGVKNGEITEEEVDAIVVKTVEMILKAQEEKPRSRRTERDDDKDALEVAESSAVLLKNEEGILPLKKDEKIAFIGQMAKKRRYQGAGSSRINPSYLDNAFDEAVSAGLRVSYADGYTEDGREVRQELIDEAVKLAKDSDIICLFAGLPDAYESEGYDRKTMAMPESHLKLIEAVADANPNTVVILQLGSPVELPFKDKVKGILLSYLSGQAGGKATVELLTGEVNPSGRLAETWPKRLADTPAFESYPGRGLNAFHRESIYIGYRYYDKAKVEVEYPFGYGLSYTTFEYSDPEVDKLGNNRFNVRVKVRNTGKCAGSHAVLLFTGRKDDGIVFRPVRELKGFDKVMLEPGESKVVEFELDERAFAYFNTETNDWAVEGGTYVISAGDLKAEVEITGDGKEKLLEEKMKKLPSYLHPSYPFDVTDKEFELLYGKELPADQRDPDAPFDINNTLYDIKDTFIGKTIIKAAGGMLKQYDKDPAMRAMVEAMMFEMPLRSLRMTGTLTYNRILGIVDMANKKPLKGIWKLLHK